VFTHVFLVFIVPSTMLGTISPVVAKMALDRGLPTGRTVGNIYAWGAVGSIAGTFAAGYYLIALMGSIMIVWIVAGILLLMGLFYCVRLWPVCLWAALFLLAMAVANVPVKCCQVAGAAMVLREKPDPQLLYKKETAYSYVTVRRQSTQPDKRVLMLDKLAHSKIVMDDITNLQYFYTRIYAAVTAALSAGKEKLSVLVIGGGGYVYPRYVEKTWPESLVEVVEIDPEVTEAAIKAFGLEPKTGIKILTMDARNYVDEILDAGKQGRYDFIYEDAISDFSVPFQLVTKQFNDKIANLLAEDGVYMITLIDIYDYARFLAAVVNTLRKTFPDVYVLAEKTQPTSARDTFVVVAGKKELGLRNRLAANPDTGSIWCLTPAEVEGLTQKAAGMVLTDDYAPVENLLTSVVCQSAKGFMAQRYLQQAKQFAQKGQLEKSVSCYKKAARAKRELTIDAYGEIGLLYARYAEHSKAAEAFKKAIEYYEQTDGRRNIASIHFNLGLSLQNLGENENAEKHLHKAVEGFREALQRYPNSSELHAKLASALIGINDFDGAVKAFGRAIELRPDAVINYTHLIDLLESRGRYDEAISVLDKLIERMQSIGSTRGVKKLRQYRELMEFRKWEASNRQ
jgi:tetratricopeptide (TPR) repeat protein/spermidine synthase